MQAIVPSIESERLVIRPVTHADSKSVHELRSNPLVNQWVKRSQTKNLDDAKAFIDKCNKQSSNNECVYWGIQEKGKGRMIGSISLWNYSADRKKAELGYDLLPEYWNRGYLSEIVPLVLSFGVDKLKFQIIDAYTQQQNQASIKLLEKCNFVLDPKQNDPDNADNQIFVYRT